MKFKKVLEKTLNEMGMRQIQSSNLLDTLILGTPREKKVQERFDNYIKKMKEKYSEEEVYKKMEADLKHIRNFINQKGEYYKRLEKDLYSYGDFEERKERLTKFYNFLSNYIQKNKQAVYGASSGNTPLSPEKKEEWLSDNTNLELKRGHGAINIEHKGQIMPLPNFLKQGIDQFFALKVTKEKPKKDEIKVTASFKNKQDLILPNGGPIQLNKDPENKRTSRKFAAGSAFELKDYIFKNLEGSYIFQSARVSTYGQAMKIIKENFKENAIELDLPEEGKMLVDINKIEEIVTSKKDTTERKAYRKALKDFLERGDVKKELSSKIINFLKDGSVGAEFFQNLTAFLNKEKTNIVDIPDNLYIMATGGKALSTPNNIERNFNELDNRIIKLKHENIFFSVEAGRISFDHIEANFTFNENYNKIAKDIISLSEFTEPKEKNKEDVRKIKSSIPGVDDENFIAINIKIPVKFNMNIGIKQK